MSRSFASTTLVATILFSFSSGVTTAQPIAAAAKDTPVMTLISPLGPDPVPITSFSGREEISRLFQFELQLTSRTPLSFDALASREISVRLSVPDRTARHFSGICSRVTEATEKNSFVYRLEMVPKLWFLTKKTQSRIYQDKTIVEVIRQTLQDSTVPFELTLQGNYPPRHYIVQYNESDFDFISRLMEEEGIWYFFRQSESGHVMVLADTPQAHPSAGTIVFGAAEGITKWEKSYEMKTVKYTQRDYNFHAPSLNLEFSAAIQTGVLAGTVNHPLATGMNSQWEIYDYPGGYGKRFDGAGGLVAEGQRTVQIRMQEEAAGALVIQGSSASPGLISGYGFTLASSPHANGDYVITGVQHAAGESSSGKGGEYSNTFTCIPAGLPYRPARITPRPIIPGTQTAMVVGPAGEQSHSDTFSRVKVQFHWDRQGQRNENSSCWIRVASPHAGSSRGFFVLPEVGDEVLVAFMEGDPDRPVIVGTLWNAERPPSPTQ